MVSQVAFLCALDPRPRLGSWFWILIRHPEHFRFHPETVSANFLDIPNMAIDELYDIGAQLFLDAPRWGESLGYHEGIDLPLAPSTSETTSDIRAIRNDGATGSDGAY